VASFAFLFKAPSVFTGSFVGVILVDAVCSQVSKFVRHPVAEPFLTHVAVGVYENGPAGQVSEHYAGESRGHMEAKESGGIKVFPVRHEENSQRKNLGLHDPNLSG
jgi:hypothetical protein